MTHHSFPFFAVPRDSLAIKVLCLWFGVLVFFFSPDVVHAEFLDSLGLYVVSNCKSNNVEWAKNTSQRMVWKEGFWGGHPTLKLLGRLVKWLPKL